MYYDLIKERRDRGLEDKIAINTIEQICPFPFDIVKRVTDQADHTSPTRYFVPENHGTSQLFT